MPAHDLAAQEIKLRVSHDYRSHHSARYPSRLLLPVILKG
jgi:hypothetical protein